MKKIILSSVVAFSLAFGVCDNYESCPLSTNCEDTDNLTYKQEQVCWGVKSDDALEKVRELQKKLVDKEIKEYSAELEEMEGVAMEYMDSDSYKEVLNTEINATIDMFEARCTRACSLLRGRFHNICYNKCTLAQYTELKNTLENRLKGEDDTPKALVP